MRVSMPRAESALGQNHPNPFNPTTSIEYELAAPANTVIVIYRADGERVVFLTFLADGTGTLIQMFDGESATIRTLGTGLNPVILWAYWAIPLANSFRHVERVLAVGGFWISILIAAAVDYIWIKLRTATWWTETAVRAPASASPTTSDRRRMASPLVKPRR